jgi:hypothetical protein
MRFFYSILLLLFCVNSSVGQFIRDDETDKCGRNLLRSQEMYELLGDHWGYSYDSLLTDMLSWESSEYVQTLSIGQSTQGREIYELMITNPAPVKNNKQRIYIHARTHPNEVQSFWVTNEIIDMLIAESPIGIYLRERCIFHIVPMYNPDGVELELDRYNANGIDIESNWNASSPEIEVFHLRNRLSDLMLEANPIKVALNMHSAYVCKRYFVYHHENGTSPLYAGYEEDFIESVRSHFYQGIEPFNYYSSWQNSTPAHYPESWWWINHQEEVMALTYEDMNCSTAGLYDKTAFAILHGISDYLDLGFIGITEEADKNSVVVRAYPNPFSQNIRFEWNNFDQLKHAEIVDVLGRQVYRFTVSETNHGQLHWNGKHVNGSELAAGTYFLRFLFHHQIKTVQISKR